MTALLLAVTTQLMLSQPSPAVRRFEHHAQVKLTAALVRSAISEPLPRGLVGFITRVQADGSYVVEFGSYYGAYRVEAAELAPDDG